MIDANPPIPLTASQAARLRPIATAPQDDALPHLLAWHDGNIWLSTWGQYHHEHARWQSDPVLTRTRTLPAEPTHWVPHG
jgi:hypothetical protein